MAKSADIMVQVGADIASLQQGMTKGAKSVKDFGAKTAPVLKDAANEIAKVGAAAAAAAAGGLLAMTKSATAAGRELKIFSQISNTSVSEFQNLASAAAEFGITNEKLADQLKDVKDRVGDFLATGGGPMADFFENIAPKVGVTAEQFNKLSGSQALQLYISSLEKANLSQSEMTFYLEAMASDLTQLQPLFANNGKLIDENARRLDDLGLKLSDLDVAQLDEGAKAFARMAESSKAASNVIGAKLSPFVVQFNKELEKAGKNGFDLGKSIEKGARAAFKGLGFLADRLHEIKFLFKGLQSAFKFVEIKIYQGLIGISGFFRDFSNNILGNINNIIAAIKLIPGTEDIPFFKAVQKGDFTKSLEQSVLTAKTELSGLNESLQSLALSEYPSEAIDEFYNNAIAGANNLKVAATGARNAITGGGDGEGDDELTKEQQDYQMRLDEFSRFLDKKLVLQKNSSKTIVGLINQQWGQAAAGTAGAMKNILGTMSSESKKAFEISKKWALADAIISTAQGIAAGVRLGWPMAIPAVAWAAATGLAQINQIKSQRFGGGASSSPSAGASSSTTASAPTGGGGAAGAQQGQTLTVAPIDPDAIFSGASMQALATRLAEFSADGGTIVTEQ